LYNALYRLIIFNWSFL